MKVTHMGVPRGLINGLTMVFLTSVRFGAGANEATDEGTTETRTRMAVIASNNLT